MFAARNTEPSTNPLSAIPTPVIALVALMLLAVFGYAVLTGQIFLWFLLVFALSALSLAAYLCVLFFRLVVAVERIADQQ